MLVERGHLKPSDIGIEETIEDQAAVDEEQSQAGVIARGGSAEQIPGLGNEEDKEKAFEEFIKDNRDDLIGKAVAKAQAEKEEIERGRKK